MTDIQTRPFSKNYSGLINQSVIAIGITVLCVGSHEFMKRRRRGRYNPQDELGSRESWEFGYLYQGRSWARFPSPPSPKGWILSWVGQALAFPEDKLHELRGIDATLYTRFLRGCFYFALLQTLTTLPILFPIHVRFSDDSISPKSMTRASISSLVGTSTGRSLLWIHICLLFWVTLSWMATLLWICNGTFKLRAADLDAASRRINSDYEADNTHFPHPHPQFRFTEVPLADRNHPNRGLRCRTIMVSNLPLTLRNEKELKEYFEYYMTRKVEKPSMGLTSSVQPGFFNKSLAFLFNRAKRLPAQITPRLPGGNRGQSIDSAQDDASEDASKPVIERVVIARKMTELASFMERREFVLRRLETAHIKLANKTLLAVKAAMERQSAKKPLAHSASKAMGIARQQRKSLAIDVENGVQEEVLDEEARMEQLIKVLGPFVEEFGLQDSLATRSKKVIISTSQDAFKKLRPRGSDSDNSDEVASNPNYPPRRLKHSHSRATVWDALLSLPRSSLDAYQPLIHLERVFSGQLVPSIDYWTAKLNYAVAMITEQRAKSPTDFEPLSTAFVTFADPADARRACRYLAVHPNNPLTCLVTMAPMYNDLDWVRVMKSSLKVELIKDWVVDIGGFYLILVIPVSLLVGLVSIQNISLFWPSLKRYLDHHPWQSEVIESFLPTLLVALLALLIPLILLLIAKKAHTMTTLSALHDRIMTRYYKFLIVNVLVFFCVGTAALQSVLQSFRSQTQPDVLKIVADSFPTAGPFYVGWLVFTTAVHGGFELALFGVPSAHHVSFYAQAGTPHMYRRKRAVGIRPRTFNFYYWLPNHMLVIHVLLLFSVLNPFVLPFGTLYFFIQSGVIKNQFIHVYAKHYEGNGQLLLIRIVRYSLDGKSYLHLTCLGLTDGILRARIEPGKLLSKSNTSHTYLIPQSVFLAYMVVLKKSVNVGLSVFLIVFTVIVKVILTRMCRTHFETQDILEADILCNKQTTHEPNDSEQNSLDEETRTATDQEGNGLIRNSRRRSRLVSSFRTWKLPDWVNFTYSSVRHRTHQPQRRPPIPFGTNEQSFSRLHSVSMDQQELDQVNRGFVPQSPLTQSGNQVTQDVKHFPKPRPHPIPSLEAKPVVPHPPPIPWDDQGTPDLPYDNPFYTRTIDNSLWLPRNPCELLSLDDTVDLKTSLTVELAAGGLGTFPYGPTTAQLDSNTSPAALARELPEVDGTEEIDLPPAIVRRVQAGEQDIERIPRPQRPRTSSGYRGKLSGAAKSTLSLGSALSPGPKPRRPSILGPSHSSSLGSTSDGREHGGRGRSHSIMSTLQLPPPIQRAQSSDHELGVRHEVHLQADPIPTNASTSRVSLAPPFDLRSSGSQNLSASNAILREVVAEEQDAKENRIREEQNETRPRMNRYWWTSWMFKKL
ncbi:hypothetical protein D9756_004691 [Leucocoprinus leucothites]|uniref:DUF221-domain-containing protein n=1 Tax=Leucocoprinus leucothites TaxID=201217 RepID=A0A8H5LKQ1_9AGAR|nr:hypothetical protein D9756_004691 [Leucoagaricus leucothites]